MAATSPYTTSAAVVYLLQVHLKGASDFNKRTTPTDTVVDQMIGWVSAQIDQQFAAAGYTIPFADLSGTAWPSTQTDYLGLVASLGTAAMAGGYALRPAPALGPGQSGSSGNILQDLFNVEIARIFTPGRKPNSGTSQIRFMADYRPGTVAEELVLAPKGATTDFMEGKFDPSRFLGLWEVTDRVLQIEKSMWDLEIQWDHLYSLFDLNKGFGTSIYEPVW